MYSGPSFWQIMVKIAVNATDVVRISMDRSHHGPLLFSSFYVTVPRLSNLYADGLKDPAIKNVSASASRFQD